MNFASHTPTVRLPHHKRFVSWIDKLRSKDGKELLPCRYTGIVAKARTQHDLLHVVHDFDERVGKGTPNAVFLCAAISAASKLDKCQPSIVANLLKRIPLTTTVPIGVCISVMTKAASTQDSSLARLAFDQLKTTSPIDAWLGLLRTAIQDVSQSCAILDSMLMQTVCKPQTDPRVVDCLLKFAIKINQVELVHKVWQWALALRQHWRQQTHKNVWAVIFMYSQYLAHSFQQRDFMNCMSVWREWRHSAVETSATHPCFGSFHRATMVMFSSHPATSHEAIDLLQELVSAECEQTVDVKVFGSALKCAANVQRFDLAIRVWRWSEPIRKYRLDGGGGQDCDVAIQYAQFVTMCAKNNQIKLAFNVWVEWEHSTVELRKNARKRQIVHFAALTAFSTHNETLSVASAMLKQVLLTQCASVHDIGAALKCAINLRRIDLADRVWQWAQPIRNVKLKNCQEECDIALQYAQYTTLCGQKGKVNRVLDIWQEWCNSKLESNSRTLHRHVFRCAVMVALCHDAETQSIAKEMLEDMLFVKCESDWDVQLLGSTLKCAISINCTELLDRVWNWGKPIRYEKISAKEGETCDIALQYAQYITSCAQAGRVHNALTAWFEWRDSKLASSQGENKVETVYRAVLVNLSTFSSALPVVCELLDSILAVKCHLQCDIRHFRAILKCAGNMNDFKFVERVWDWGRCMREQRLKEIGSDPDSTVLAFTQFAALCAQNGRTGHILTLWNEWNDSSLVSNVSAPHQSALRDVVLSSLCNFQDNIVVQGMLHDLVLTEWRPHSDTQTLEVVLRCANCFQCFELVDYVWHWARPVRQSHTTFDIHLLAFFYTQYVKLCAKHYQVNQIIHAWREWNEFRAHQKDAVERATMSALSVHPTTVLIACEMLENVIFTECHPNNDPQLLGSALKCASNVNRLDLLERIWLWGEPIRKCKEFDDDKRAMVYTQYVALCGKCNQVNQILQAWCEWNEFREQHNDVVERATMSALSVHPTTVLIACEMLENVIFTECHPNNDPQLLGSALKCASNMNRLDLLDRVWLWGEPIRQFQFQLDTQENTHCSISFIFLQYLTFCGQAERQLKLWREWNQTMIGFESKVLSTEIFRGATMVSLSFHLTTAPIAKEMLLTLISTRCEHSADAQVLGSALKCAKNFGDLDLIECVWEWGKPVRQHRLAGGGGKDCEIALVYIQYITLCGQLGHVGFVRKTWNEWHSSVIGSNLHAHHQGKLRNAVISALAMHGQADIAESVYNEQSLSDPKDNEIMLVSLLTAYSRAGLYERAVSLLDQVIQVQKSISTQVFTVAVDACSRAGKFDLALDIINKMQNQDMLPNEVTWMAILGPCRVHGNLNIAELAFNQLQKVANKENQAAAFVLLADVYSNLGQFDKAKSIQAERKLLGMHKKRGAVEVTVHEKQHTFHVGEVPNELKHVTQVIHAKLDEWQTLLHSRGISSSSLSFRHSEKLALAFAVVSGQQDVTIRKNLRICLPCHDAAVAITETEHIVIRHLDPSRAHVMRNGSCSCGGRF